MGGEDSWDINVLGHIWVLLYTPAWWEIWVSLPFLPEPRSCSANVLWTLINRPDYQSSLCSEEYRWWQAVWQVGIRVESASNLHLLRVSACWLLCFVLGYSHSNSGFFPRKHGELSSVLCVVNICVNYSMFYVTEVFPLEVIYL